MKKWKMCAMAAGMCMLLLFLTFLIVIKGKQGVSPAEITFDIRAKEQDFKVRLWHNYYDGKEYLFLPSFCDEAAQCLVKAEHAFSKSWDGEKLGIWGYLKQMEDGEHVLEVNGAEYTVVVMRSAKVPALFLTTESGSLSYIEAEKGNEEAGLYRMIQEDGSVRVSGQMRKIKARGNATFLEDKKPYTIELEGASDWLNTGAQEKYILLANRQERSMLRNKIMYDMAAGIGLTYSPASTFVDLYINEEYRGTYQICEKIETGSGRLSIDVDSGRAETGFLAALEYADAERLAEAVYYFTTENEQNIVVESPRKPTNAQIEYVKEVFNKAEKEIRNGNLKEAGIDVKSFARKYLMEEIGKNLDAMHSSQYFYKDAGNEELMYAGPVWDYDKTLGNPLIEKTRPVNYQEPRGIFAATKQGNASWWYDLYQIPEFRETVIEEYKKEAAPAIRSMLEGRIDGYTDEIWGSAYMDYVRWDSFEHFKYEEEADFAGAYQEEIDSIKDFLEQRMEFLDDIWLENRIYDQITCDPGDGVMYVTKLDAIEGRTIHEPRDPKLEGYDFAYWVREDTGEIYDFTEAYDGVPFTLKAVYTEEEEHG